MNGFFGITGSKQPQDFGVNANLGVRGSLNFSRPLRSGSPVGFQLGTAATVSGNAVQVFELLGESTGRTQSFTTAGVFLRTDDGLSCGAVYDFLYQESFDQFSLGQWRIRLAQQFGPALEIGATVNLASRSDSGHFANAARVRLEPIEQLHLFVRRNWESGATTTFWFGVADEHSEENVVTGGLPNKTNPVLFGADLFAPLNNHLALYGETNLMMPADTGTVDAFLGVSFFPGGIFNSRTSRYRPLFEVAGSPSFSVNLARQ